MDKLYVAKLMYHKWEEDVISGLSLGYAGTFAIFFYGCNMHCVFCQNYKISRMTVPDIKKVDSSHIFTPDTLAKEMINAEKNNAKSISFITGAFYLDLIVETIKIAKSMGLSIPIVYNTNAYEKAEHIKKLDGLIDIYLPDFKYYDDALGKKYSNVSDYVEVAKASIAEMHRQVKSQMIVRHLVLPSHTEDSKKVIKYLYDTYGDYIYISIMSQYTPIKENKELEKFKEIDRRITSREYDKVVSFAMEIGVKNAYIQEDMAVAKESFIPDFTNVR